MNPAALGAVALVVVALTKPPQIPVRHRRFQWVMTSRATSSARRGAEIEWVEALAAELRAGRDPWASLLAADSSTTSVVNAAATAAAGTSGDVGAALRVDPRSSDLLRGVAACWDVAAGSGAGLASSLTTLADSAREAERARHELRAGLAEPRATAVVLACLPLLGLALGTVLGADPVSWLLGSATGAVVLAAGLLLEAVGAWWAWRIASSLESSV
jgi:tight adherence protein B